MSTSKVTLSPNFVRITVGSTIVWWSYDTVIAFHTPETGIIRRVNEWGTTTGKHINAVPTSTTPVPGERFEELLEENTTPKHPPRMVNNYIRGEWEKIAGLDEYRVKVRANDLTGNVSAETHHMMVTPETAQLILAIISESKGL